MGLVEKLEKRARELDPFIAECDYKGRWQKAYDQQRADDRELLEQAAKRIRSLETGPFVLPPGATLTVISRSSLYRT